MITAPVDTTSPYSFLGTAYEHALNAHGVRSAMLTHKWQQPDLLTPHSDLDIRILLHDPPQDWWEWNQRLAAAHAAAVSRDVANRRLLEHPPGFAFTVSEVDRRRVAPAEVATWSLINGHPRTFHRWKSQAQMAPWSQSDERFYRAILDARLNGRYQLTADSIDNVIIDVPGYRRHCVLWHYLAPSWFAIAALATRTRCPGKFAALTQWHPAGLERYGQTFLRQACAMEHAPPAPALLRTARLAVGAALRHLPAASQSQHGEAHNATEMAWTMTAGMLRVRVARWLYYLHPPPDTATGYLIRRESRELRTAHATLRALAADQSTTTQRLAGRMADLLPICPTTDQVLNETLGSWKQHHALVEDFLTQYAMPTGALSCPPGS